MGRIDFDYTENGKTSPSVKSLSRWFFNCTAEKPIYYLENSKGYFRFSPPTIQVMHSGLSGAKKDYAQASLSIRYLVIDTSYTDSAEYVSPPDTTPITTPLPYWLNRQYRYMDYELTSDLTMEADRLFGAHNKETRELDVHLQLMVGRLQSGETSDMASISYIVLSSKDLGVVTTVTLDAPPTFTASWSSMGMDATNTGYVKQMAIAVKASQVEAKYGGDVESIVLKVGDQKYEISPDSSTGTGILLPRVTGTFVPTLTVTDSRGQTTTESYPPITVVPTVSSITELKTIRIDDETGLPEDGEAAVVSMKIDYSDHQYDDRIVNYVLEPTVTISPQVDTSITWYESWDKEHGFSSPINWTNYRPASGSTLYAKIVGATAADVLDTTKTYNIGVTLNTTFATSKEYTTTLEDVFYLFYGRPGGRALGIGTKPRRDHVLDIGLEPYVALDTEATSGTDAELYAAIKALGWESEVIE